MMRKYVLAIFIVILIMLLAWNMVDSAEESKLIRNDDVKDSKGDQAGILQGTDVSDKEEIIEPEEENKEETDISEGSSIYPRGEYDEYGDQYSVVETGDGEFTITLYDKEGNMVDTAIWHKLPWVAEMTDSILQIGMTGGNIGTLIFYYDKERAIVSPYYSASFYLRDNYIAYMEDENTLVLTDIFGDGELYMEINRNFTDSRPWGRMWISIKDITWITLNGQDVVVLEYDEGEDREMITEIIPIWGEKTIVYDGLDEIAEKHEVLQQNICSPVQYDFENVHPSIKERVELEVQMNEELSQKYGKELQLSLDYHLFDFNDDGMDDYLLCVDRELYDGRVEHWIKIYITQQHRGEEIVHVALDLNLPLCDQAQEDRHKQIMVLDEKTNGYYAIVLPWSNLILRYEKYMFGYEFCDQ